MRRSQVIGLLLWRGGLVFCYAAILFEGSKFLLRWVDVPGQIEVGGGLVGVGMGLLMLSLILERIADARIEKGGKP